MPPNYFEKWDLAIHITNIYNMYDKLKDIR